MIQLLWSAARWGSRLSAPPNLPGSSPRRISISLVIVALRLVVSEPLSQEDLRRQDDQHRRQGRLPVFLPGAGRDRGLGRRLRGQFVLIRERHAEGLAEAALVLAFQAPLDRVDVPGELDGLPLARQVEGQLVEAGVPGLAVSQDAPGGG